jgi:hypothetical protein
MRAAGSRDGSVIPIRQIRQILIHQPEPGSRRAGQRPATSVFPEPQTTDADHENRCINDDHIEARNDQSAACR